jgi:Flp pilus assembly protein TadG
MRKGRRLARDLQRPRPLAAAQHSHEGLTVPVNVTVTLPVRDTEDCGQSDVTFTQSDETKVGQITVMKRASAGAVIRAALLRGREAASDCAGAAAVEFALILPVLLTMLVAIIQFGIVLNNYLEVTDAARTGGRTFAVSRTSGTPYTSTTTAVTTSAANLTAGSITTTVSVNGTACSTDGGCSTALGLAQGGSATVTVTYPCLGPAGSSFTFYVQFFATACTLTSSTTDLIE